MRQAQSQGCVRGFLRLLVEWCPILEQSQQVCRAIHGLDDVPGQRRLRDVLAQLLVAVHQDAQLLVLLKLLIVLAPATRGLHHHLLAFTGFADIMLTIGVGRSNRVL